jgi:hypothetical protein
MGQKNNKEAPTQLDTVIDFGSFIHACFFQVLINSTHKKIKGHD